MKTMPKIFTAHRPKPAKPTQAGAPPRRRPSVSRAKLDQAAEAAKFSPAEPGKDKPDRAKEIGGPSGPEPTRYGDWERNGICVDF
ncbi:MAG: DUF1674 domain-containing protein [Kiloniellaceae bacterium]